MIGPNFMCFPSTWCENMFFQINIERTTYEIFIQSMKKHLLSGTESPNAEQVR